MSVDFANILFGGPCNRRCWFCIGKELPRAFQQDNLDVFPPKNLEGFIEAVLHDGTRQIVFTGTVTDPQLYRHEARLLEYLRGRLPGRIFSVHTNGALALKKIDVFNLYDKACISFPSFDPATYERMMGSPKVPDLAAIVTASRIPLKVSCLLSDDDYESFVHRCRSLGIRRVVLRRLYGDNRDWPMPWQPVRHYRGNPVFDVDGMEVTYWSFEDSRSTSLNLFPDGTLGTSYLLARTTELGASLRY